MLSLPREPILARSSAELTLLPGWIAEPKWDGFRAFAARRADGAAVLQSRRGADLARAFPEITAAAADLPEEILLDGEIVSWRDGRLAFEDLPDRLRRAGPAAARLAAEHPVHYVAFDLLNRDGVDFLPRPYAERRAALEGLFAELQLGAPWVLCPASDDLADVREWLGWSVVGVEGVVIKNRRERYRPGVRAWRKYRVRASAEAVIGAVTGPLHRPRSLLLGRLDAAGRLHYVGRTAPLPAGHAEQLGRSSRKRLGNTRGVGGGSPRAGAAGRCWT